MRSSGHESTALSLIAALTLSGCATIWTLSGDRVEYALCHTPNAPAVFSRVFSGVHTDLFCLGGVTERHASETGFVVMACLIDAPLSLAADTVVLPFTIFKQIRLGSYHPRLVPEIDQEIYGTGTVPSAIASHCSNRTVQSERESTIQNKKQPVP